MIGRIQDGDIVEIDATSGTISVSADDDVAARAARIPDESTSGAGMGRELFAVFREKVSSADSGATIFRGTA